MVVSELLGGGHFPNQQTLASFFVGFVIDKYLLECKRWCLNCLMDVCQILIFEEVHLRDS